MRNLFVLFLLVVTVAALLSAPASAVPFHFPVVANDKKCFTEELSTSRYVLAYSMRRALSQFVSITVTGEGGNKVWEKRNVEEEGNTVLTPPRAGPYTVCFHINKKAKAVTVPLIIEMNLELESVQHERNAKHYSNSEDGHVEDPAIPQAEYLDRTIRAVKDAYDYFRLREQSLRNTNESSNSRMLILTISSMVLVVGVTCFKEWKLHKFLKKKKFLD